MVVNEEQKKNENKLDPTRERDILTSYGNPTHPPILSSTLLPFGSLGSKGIGVCVLLNVPTTADVDEEDASSSFCSENESSSSSMTGVEGGVELVGEVNEWLERRVGAGG